LKAKNPAEARKAVEIAFRKLKDKEGLEKFKAPSTIEAIKKGVKAKFDQNKELQTKLLETKGITLTCAQEYLLSLS